MLIATTMTNNPVGFCGAQFSYIPLWVNPSCFEDKFLVSDGGYPDRNHICSFNQWWKNNISWIPDIIFHQRCIPDTEIQCWCSINPKLPPSFPQQPEPGPLQDAQRDKVRMLWFHFSVIHRLLSRVQICQGICQGTPKWPFNVYWTGKVMTQMCWPVSGDIPSWFHQKLQTSQPVGGSIYFEVIWYIAMDIHTC